jgi:hypothetical protein
MSPIKPKDVAAALGKRGGSVGGKAKSEAAKERERRKREAKEG